MIIMVGAGHGDEPQEGTRAKIDLLKAWLQEVNSLN